MKLYTQKKKRQHFRDQEATTFTLYLFKCGVSELFQETLTFAHDAGAHFNGVLCGRATWSGAVKVYIEQGEQAQENGYVQLDIKH